MTADGTERAEVRLAEATGLDEQQRAAVYYTALLVNVGCHTDAHEQAKWAADDIEMKSGKYLFEPKSLKESAHMLRRMGAGNPLPHRLRIGLAFALGGYKDVVTMIESHAKLARRLGEEIGLPGAVTSSLEACYEWWDGKGYPGALAGEAIPFGSRAGQLAEYAEVAQRTNGTAATSRASA